VDERSVETQWADWYGPVADKAVTDYLADPKADRATVGKVTALWAIRGDIVHARQDRERLQRQTSDLSQSTEETRRNLRAIEKNKTADALRQKLTARLADASARLDDLNRKLVEVDAKLAELGVRFSEAVREIDLTL
jgi:seryl-tRNA synthetase